MKVFVPKDPQPLLPEDLGQQTREKLASRYPWQFRLAYWDKKRKELNVYIEPGWARLVQRVCERVDAIVPKEKQRHFSWRQQKEKYAGLRMYFTPGPFYADINTPEGVATVIAPNKKTRGLGKDLAARIQRTVKAAGKLSRRTCQKCGARGELRVQGRWYMTLCAGHFDPQKAPRAKASS